MRLGWTQRQWLAAAALAASVTGAAVLTGYSLWLAWLLADFGRGDARVRAQVIEALARGNYALLAIIGAVLLSLGLAINRRSLRAAAFGASLEADGGDAPAGEDDHA